MEMLIGEGGEKSEKGRLTVITRRGEDGGCFPKADWGKDWRKDGGFVKGKV